MTKKSMVVDHLDRAKIEHALASGTPIRQLSKKFGVSIHSLYRHRAKLPPQMRAQHMALRLKGETDLNKLRVSESEGILTNLALQRQRLLLMQDAALLAGDGRAVGYLADIIMRNVKLTGAYLGEFARHEVKTSVNVLISEDYLQLRRSLLDALAPFPDARRAVIEALHEREAQAAAEPAKPVPPMIEGTAQEVASAA